MSDLINEEDEEEILKHLESHPYLWGGGNLGPEEDSRSYEEWLKYYGVDEEEEDDK